MEQSIHTDRAGEPITSRAARFIAGLHDGTLPADIADKARTCLLYGLGIGLLCLKEPMARLAEHAATAMDGEAGARGATSLATGRRVPVASAVFANAALLHGLEGKFSFQYTVALALLEAGYVDPADFIAGIVAGYEFGGTLESAFGRETMGNGLRASPLYGALAAAAAAARLLRLPAAQIDAALANAAAFTGGTMQTVPEGSDEWRCMRSLARSI